MWRLSGNNSYTGTTTLNAGTLAFGAGTNSVIGTLTLPVAGTVTINLGTGSTVAFATGSPTWTATTLNLTGSFVSGSSLRFGTTSSGLTAAQLLKISATGFSSFALDSNGYLTATGTGGYATWAATNAPSSTPNDDYDGDGVSNGLEYVLGGTALTKDLSKLPKLSTSGGNLIFTFERDQQSIKPDTTVVIEVGTDLATWPSPSPYAVPDGATGPVNPGVTVVKDSPVLGKDTITLTVPQAPDAKKFARLKVTVTTP